jgi:predicted metal-dependent peptidase
MSNNQWDKLTPTERIKKVHVDFMKHKEFALLSGVTMVGKVEVTDKIPTACTNGRDVLYGEKFIMGQNQKQLRYLVAHENMHKALRHSTEYVKIAKQFPEHFGVAIDLTVNGLIEEMDPKFEFVERPTLIPPLVDPKFKGWSMMRILKYLLTKYPPPPKPEEGDDDDDGDDKGKGKGKGTGKGKGKPQKGKGKPGSGEGDEMGQTLDEHDVQDGEGDEALTEEELKEAKRQIEDAVRQGKLIKEKLGAGNGAGGGDLTNHIQERDTNWKQYLREFVTQIVKGDDNSRFCPPNKRMLASGFIMPSHFSESTGELHIYCDTSGSMTGVYPIVFGEVVRIVQDVRPDKVRIIWWDTAVAGEQVFEPKDYDNIATAMQPKGGGGTTPDVVRRYVDDKKYTAKCGIWLTDGDFYTSAVEMPWPVIWGVIGNDQFVPVQGTVVNIEV